MDRSSAHRIIRAFVVAGIVAFVPRATHAQTVVPGNVVRITSARSTFGGPLLSRDSAALVILRHPGDTLRFLHADITSAEVLRGRRRAGTGTIGKGALIGLGIGSALAIAALLDKSGYQDTRELKGLAAIFFVVSGTATGTVIGTVASFRRVDHWIPFNPRVPPEAPSTR